MVAVSSCFQLTVLGDFAKHKLEEIQRESDASEEG
jgi:hypothetical protein